MAAMKHPESLVGKRLRWTWTEGPTAGMTHEHHFLKNGRVDFKRVDSGASPAGKGGDEGHADRYAAERVSDSVHLVSYLSGSGYTLTVALDFGSGSLVGFASNDKNWHPLRGTFEMAS